MLTGPSSLPRKNTSLLIYLTAFLFQLPLHPSNRLTVESISVMFGPSMLGPRFPIDNMQNTQERTIKRSQEGLKWLLDNWDDSLSQDLLDEEYDCLAHPILDNEAWVGDRSDGEAEEIGDKPSAFSAQNSGQIQYPSQRSGILHEPAKTPAMSMMASPMLPNYSQDTSSSTGSPLPDGWGSAISSELISSQEDQAMRQKVLQQHHARKSSFNLDPDLASTSRTESNPQSSSHTVNVSGNLRNTFVDGRNVEMAFKPMDSFRDPVTPSQVEAEPSSERRDTANHMSDGPDTSAGSVLSSRSSELPRPEGTSVESHSNLSDSTHMPGNLPLYSPASDSVNLYAAPVHPSLEAISPAALPTDTDPRAGSTRNPYKVERALPIAPAPQSPGPAVTARTSSEILDYKPQTSSTGAFGRDSSLHSRENSSLGSVSDLYV